VPAEPAIWSDARLVGTRFTDVRWFTVVDSTNRYLLDLAAANAPEGVVAVADEQTAGRGRLDRTWIAPAGAALLVSVLLRPRVAVERRHLVTLAAALAALDALDDLAPDARGRVKWPNDLVVDGRKLAGVLAESDGNGAVVVGMGLNVRGDWFPPDLADIATAVDVDREELLVAWLRAYDARLDALDAVVPAATDRSATIGRAVRVELGAETFSGTAERLTPEGYLVVDGRVITAGDVIHVR
jgi:BirA family biotin operon repressor/biotin-[acetyl-CoA-carboxylase] ligase